jgi:hypothetical protein
VKQNGSQKWRSSGPISKPQQSLRAERQIPKVRLCYRNLWLLLHTKKSIVLPEKA